MSAKDKKPAAPKAAKSPVPKKAAGRPTKTERTMTAQQHAFVREYLVDRNATQAAIRAGYSKNSASKLGFDLLNNPLVRAAVEEGEKRLAEATDITAEKVLKRYWAIATADPNELVEHRIGACHYCWGREHQYQWTPAEYEKAVTKSRKANEETEPDCIGGLDYNKTREPHPSCPECHGEGVPYTVIKDTRTVTGAARMLYAGMKEGKEGIEIKLHNQLDALNNVAKHLGMFVEKKQHELTGPNGGPIQTETRVVVVPAKNKAEVSVKPLQKDGDS